MVASYDLKALEANRSQYGVVNEKIAAYHFNFVKKRKVVLLIKLVQLGLIYGVEFECARRGERIQIADLDVALDIDAVLEHALEALVVIVARAEAV